MASSLPSTLPISFTTAQACAFGLSRARLRWFVDQGALEPIARGAYRRADAPLADLDLVEIALRAPEATLCLESALERYDLTDRIGSAIDIALPRPRRQPATVAPVRWHRFAEATFDLGRQLITLEPGLQLGIYSAERTIVDVFRLRHREGSDVAHEALRRWLRDHRGQPAQLLELASHFRVGATAIRAALEVLL
jgi:predicted transcriptional regulator of viral defense system